MPDSNPLHVSITELKDYMRCRRLWDVISPNRQGLRPRGLYDLALSVGSAVHYALAAQADGRDPLAALHSHLSHVEIGLSVAADLETFAETRALATALVERYFERYGMVQPLAPYRYLAAELTFRIPFPSAGASTGREVYLVGTIDGVAQHPQTGELAVVEHKTYSSAPSRRWLRTDWQLTGYVYALSALIRRPVHVGLYDGIAKSLPNEPKVLKDGMLSQAWITQTETDYRRALAAHHGPDWEAQHGERYADFLARLRTRDQLPQTPFYSRFRLRFSASQLESWALRAGDALREIATNPPIYPNYLRNGCWDCWAPVADLCQGMELGHDVDYLRRGLAPSGGYGTSTTLRAASPERITSLEELVAFCSR